MTHWKLLLLRLLNLLKRYPGLIALFGFVSGIASFILVDRQEGVGRVIAVLMLLSWVWLLFESLLTRSAARWLGLEVPPVVLRYVTQLIHQESLFFVLPFFFVTTAWNSGQALFTSLLGLAALVAIVDPLYYRWLARRRWMYLGYHTLTLFAVLLTALPLIVHLTTAESYRLALAAALLLSFPSLASSLHIRRGWRWLALCGLIAALGGVGWLARPWVPPATLWLTEVAVTAQMDNASRAPGETLRQIDAMQLRSNGLYAYTAINAPRGLDERIYHVWRHNDEVVDRIALDIHGGRKAGYRAWTHKRNFPGNPEGDWQVWVVTEAGQQIGTLRFSVTGAGEATNTNPLHNFLRGDAPEEDTQAPPAEPEVQQKQEEQPAADAAEPGPDTPAASPADASEPAAPTP
ncbi:DUF2914 domain-containing protein [Pseudomonas sp. PDM14]|uniref:DUF5924 family protein n=1 Tax=Pseudomonas sp. PDM14 TaxID=2769288 RepID=UPI001781D4E3|nr:DUF5924 family protein [Pseudomonas sp. PDM14]MBD9483449.1 DUF2914 domain-containing protein [Pseudomonas sp. PDM14]